MTLPDTVQATPRLPLDQDGGPVFNAPWEARVFAMTLQAYDAGIFNWREWAEALGAELAKDDDNDNGEMPGYYNHWLNAFERLLADKRVAGAKQLEDLKQAWNQAARATPHGQPIELKRSGN
ncbi:MAG: nitrile hydratase accessory protein [Roseibium sp.]|uniref:nitrile hydratase accessory protein n=1 Tax=Roseibium sp. TaxID=1936156 RepID=UPI002624CDBC|nr:nitrile hydratase accessory protein [Roseibium sp.]MCV0428783.1 nitrile hydratase accessory protein [Roseibium sp.]